MEEPKERARKALRIRINDLTSFLEINQLIHDAVEEIWNIFENNIVEQTLREREDGKKTNGSKSEKDIKRRINQRKEIDIKAEKVLWCKGKEV